MINIPKPDVASKNEHSVYSPSGSKRWLNCTASIEYLKTFKRKQGEPNFYAEEGTCAHELSAHCLDSDMDAKELVGSKFNNILVDTEMAKETQKYIDYINGQDTWNSTVWVENKVSLQHLEPDMFGTADAIIFSFDEYEIEEGVHLITKGELEIVDLKYGRGVVVEATDNTQMMIYALGALTHLAKNNIKFHPSFDVKMTIVQPRAPHELGPIRSTYLTVAQLKDFQKEVKEKVKESKSKEPKFVATEEGCRWCEASPFCKAHANHNMDIAKIEFSEFELSPAEFKKTRPEPKELDEQDLVNIMKHTKAIEHWLKGITAYCLEQLQQGKKVPGYKLVYGRSNRAFKDQSKVEEILKDYGTEEDRVYKTKFLTVAQLEKELTDEEWKLVEELVFKPQGKLSLAKESDARMAVDTQAEAIDEWAGPDYVTEEYIEILNDHLKEKFTK